ncbi:MAG TPA: hypothetical protein VIG08_05285 [Gemmatimonadales bacterium]|jgi:hypothetical protein
MADRFLCSDPEIGDLHFADVESILDALEAALVSADTPLYDAARLSWQPVGLHPEVRVAWEARERFRPPDASRLVMPALPAPSLVEDDDLVLRRAAFARVRTGDTRHDEPPVRKRRIIAAAAVVAVMLLAVVGWAIVTFAVRLSQFAGGLFAVDKR